MSLKPQQRQETRSEVERVVSKLVNDAIGKLAIYQMPLLCDNIRAAGILSTQWIASARISRGGGSGFGVGKAKSWLNS